MEDHDQPEIGPTVVVALEVLEGINKKLDILLESICPVCGPAVVARNHPESAKGPLVPAAV